MGQDYGIKRENAPPEVLIRVPLLGGDIEEIDVNVTD
jgi:hypothetical protein